MDTKSKLLFLRTKLTTLKEPLDPTSWRTCAVSLLTNSPEMQELGFGKTSRGIPTYMDTWYWEGFDALESFLLGIDTEDILYIFSLTTYFPYSTQYPQEYSTEEVIRRIDEVIGRAYDHT